jgi:hypothetical protein
LQINVHKYSVNQSIYLSTKCNNNKNFSLKVAFHKGPHIADSGDEVGQQCQAIGYQGTWAIFESVRTPVMRKSNAKGKKQTNLLAIKRIQY